jgi:hypothetical protein
MKAGDMEQVDYEEPKGGWAWRSMLYFGMALFAMLLSSFITGVFFGYLIWGI